MTNNTSSKYHVREPLFHVVKRGEISIFGSIAIRAISIILALLACGIFIMAITGCDPIELVQRMLQGNFGTKRKVWITLMNLSLLQCMSLAVTPAFRMKFWNLGAEGQALIGALVSVIIMRTITPSIPQWAGLILIAVAAMIGGLIWGCIPALFKAYFNTNETLFTLMMNYIAMQLVSFFIPFIDKSGSNVIRSIASPWGSTWFPNVFGNRYGLVVVIAAILTVLMYVYLHYTKQGYEISVVGESENTARYIGINVKKVILRTMAISGLMCGLAGFIFAVGKDATVNVSTVGGMGFTAVMVSWLAKFNPAVMTLASFLIVFLENGSSQIIEDLKLGNSSIGGILTGITLFFIIGCEFFVQYKIQMRSKKEVK